MMIIGCDFHPSWQQVSWLDTETGETGEQKLVQASGDAERFYRQVAAPALIGMEATGNCHWLVDLLAELGHELWVGDAAQIRASYVRQQKTDKRDAAHILKLLVEGRFPRIWMPSSEVRDLRQLLLHRYKLVIMRARVKDELQHLCLNIRSAAEAQAVEPSRTADPARAAAAAVGRTSARRLAQADGDARPADRTVGSGGQSRSSARQNGAASSNPTRSRSDHGAGLCADAWAMSAASRAAKQVASYLGLIPREHSSGGRQKLGAITKQGNRMLRMLLVEAAQVAVVHDPGLRKQYRHRCRQKRKAVAKVAVARKLAVRLYWMLHERGLSRDRSHREQPAGAPGRRKLDRRC